MRGHQNDATIVDETHLHAPSSVLMRRTTSYVLSGDAMLAFGRSTRHVDWVEARCLDTLRVRRDDPRVRITWAVERRVVPLVAPLLAGQPSSPYERLDWCPGTTLPDRAVLIVCTVSIEAQTS